MDEIKWQALPVLSRRAADVLADAIECILIESFMYTREERMWFSIGERAGLAAKVGELGVRVSRCDGEAYDLPFHCGLDEVRESAFVSRVFDYPEARTAACVLSRKHAFVIIAKGRINDVTTKMRFSMKYSSTIDVLTVHVWTTYEKSFGRFPSMIGLF